MNTQIKGMIFDFGRVLANFDHQKTCQKLGSMTHIAPEDVFQKIFKENIEKRFDEGKLSSLEFWKEVNHVLKADISFEKFAEAWGDIFSPNPEIEMILGKLRQNLGRVVLSNTNPLHWEYIEKLGVMRQFFSEKEKLVLSFEIGAKKPAEIMYKKALERLQLKAEEVLFLDDVKEYAEAFRKLGGNAIVYDCTEQSANELLESLNQYGVLQ